MRNRSDQPRTGQRPNLPGLRSFREPTLFALIGLLNTGLDFTIFLLLTRANMPPLIANTISFSLGAINSYVLNSRLTFSVVGKHARSNQTILRFGAVTLCTLALSYAVIWAALRLAIAGAMAKALSIVVTFAVGFLMNKILVFRNGKLPEIL